MTYHKLQEVLLKIGVEIGYGAHRHSPDSTVHQSAESKNAARSGVKEMPPTKCDSEWIESDQEWKSAIRSGLVRNGIEKYEWSRHKGDRRRVSAH